MFFLDMNTLDRFGASHSHCTQGCEALDAAVDQIAESGLQLLLVSSALGEWDADGRGVG